MNKHINLAAVLVCVGASMSASARDVTLDDRLVAQKAIEQVYWNHRVWPKDNPGAKPPLSAVMPDSAIRAKVEDYLAQSNALETWWRRPITAEQLQAELDRMAKNTQDGALLNELYQALGNDAGLIAETLARQALVERLIRNWYANDTRFHAETRAKAEAARAACDRASCLKTLSGEYTETTWIRSDDRSRRVQDPKQRTVPVDDWADRLNRLATRFGVKASSVPVGRLSPLEETEDGFSVTAVLAQRDGELTTASVVWPKRSFDAWWDDARGAVGSTFAQPPGTFALPSAAPSSPCTNDTWRRTHFLAPEARTQFNAVWTGTEMIVWGGSGVACCSSGSLFNGGRYNPSTDTWTPIPPSPNGPPASWYSEAVWTGTEMIVWGGQLPSPGLSGEGARYNPTTGTWTRISNVNSPTPRGDHSVVWTGTEMIVWGGTYSPGVQFLNTGGRYNPTTDTWTPTSTTGNVPVGRDGQSAVWTGTEMILWGGEVAAGGPESTGGRYNPSNDTWTATSTGANVPSQRYYHSAIWTGTQMLIWGGEDDGAFTNTGGRYSPSTNTWAAMSTGANVPSPRQRYSAVWTGSEMIIWGGYNSNNYNTGGRYNPANNTWAATSTGANVPQARDTHQAVWTGSEMIVWGGENTEQLSTGARYSPSSNTWAPISLGAGVPERGHASEVWTGSEMVVWSGDFDGVVTNSGGRYNPALDSWTPTSLASGVPAARSGAKATWTGTEMLVWGGATAHTDLNTGGRYNPASNTWTGTSTGANAPSPRHGFSSVWTGTEMIVWGGQDPSLTNFNDGARYKPANNTWTPTSVGASVPDPRFSHSAVWSGSEMIVWGGANESGSLDAGGRYDPANDSWTPTSTGPNVPAPRRDHTAVWTGTEMIVWGGAGGPDLNTGGRYDPAHDSWSPTSTGADLPTARQTHSAVWTGEEMIVWGGTDQASTLFNTGGRYNALSDSWTPTSTGANVPPARGAHSAVWTGTEMIVWGGVPNVEQGGVYCACPNGIGVFYRDLDGDGHGNAAVSRSACSQPSGFVASGDDCDDTNAAVYPGAPELNDGLDNQCPGGSGYGIADEIADTLHVDAGGVVSWTDTSGAATFDVARSPSRDLNPCEIIGTATSASPSVTDATNPPSGGRFYYVVRAASAHVGSWGQNSSGVERSLACP